LLTRAGVHRCTHPHRTRRHLFSFLALPQMPLVIGCVRPTQGGALYALGGALPCWLAEHTHRRRAVPLPWRSDARCACCAPWRLLLPGVGAAVLAALARLEMAVTARTTATP